MIRIAIPDPRWKAADINNVPSIYGNLNNARDARSAESLRASDINGAIPVVRKWIAENDSSGYVDHVWPLLKDRRNNPFVEDDGK